MPDRNIFRVKIDQTTGTIAVIRFKWNEDQTELLGKECLNSVGEWVSVEESQSYTWINADILLKSLDASWFDAANWKLLQPK